MTSVCPALWPPWKRTTMSASSESQSTILPLPSSPHWAPTTTTFATRGRSLHATPRREGRGGTLPRLRPSPRRGQGGPPGPAAAHVRHLAGVVDRGRTGHGFSFARATHPPRGSLPSGHVAIAERVDGRGP